MVIIIEVLRQNISKYIDCEESKNAQESKLLSVLNNALMIAKWMDKISSDSQNDENDFQIPKDLQMFEAIKTKIFDAMSNCETNNFSPSKNYSSSKLPDVNKISHSKETDVKGILDASWVTKIREKSSSPALKKFKLSLNNKSVMSKYLNQKRNYIDSTLSRNYRPNLTIDVQESDNSLFTLRHKSQSRYIGNVGNKTRETPVNIK